MLDPSGVTTKARKRLRSSTGESSDLSCVNSQYMPPMTATKITPITQR